MKTGLADLKTGLPDLKTGLADLKTGLADVCSCSVSATLWTRVITLILTHFKSKQINEFKILLNCFLSLEI